AGSEHARGPRPQRRRQLSAHEAGLQPDQPRSGHHRRPPRLRADLRGRGHQVSRSVRQPGLPGRLRRAGPGARVAVPRACADLPAHRKLAAVQTMLRVAGTLAAAVLAACATAPAAGAAAGTDPVLAAAGDIACAPNMAETPTVCHQAETAAIVGAIDPTAVAVLGDNQYEVGFLPAYQSVFDATWGAFRSKTFPVPGNHEYYRVGADGYY